jgi:phosphodiesterase/alkaline phosphatase D-like protein
MKQQTLNGRRRLVKLAISAVSLSWVVCSARADANFLGVAAGDASSSEVVIWTRATNTVAASPLALIAQVAPDDPTLTTGVVTFGVSTDPARDYTAKLVLSNLLAGTRYYYRFVNASNPANASIVGTFKTAPDASAAAPVRFAFGGDADGLMRPYALASIFPSLGLDFFVFDGNTVYETASAFSGAAALTGTIPSPSPSGATQVQLFNDYSRKNREQFIAVNSGGQKNLQPLFAAQGNYTLLNNHELGDRQYINGGAAAGGAVGGMPTGAGVDARLATNDVNFGLTFINKALGFQTLQQVYLNYQPVKERGFIDAVADPRTDDTPLLFFSQQWGQNAIFIYVDDRTYRDIRMKTAANADDTGPRAANPSRTMLGVTQLDWLKQTLQDAENAGIPWKFVAVSDPIDQIGPIGGALSGTSNGGNGAYLPVNSNDGKSWMGGYRAERNDLLKFIADNHIHNVVFLTTGDHQSRVNELTYSPTGDTESQSSYVPVPTCFAIVSGPLGATGPDLVTNHTFANNKLIADSIANAQSAAAIDPIGLSPAYPGLHNVIREGDASADAVRQPTDFYSPDTFNISVLEVTPDGRTLTVTAVGINSYGQNVRPEYNPTNNPARSIFSFQVDSGIPPVFTSCPGDITATNDAGQSSALVNFTAAASGLPTPSVTCMLGGVPITSPFSFPIGVSTVTCTASNSVGTATCSFNVTVLAAPQFASCPGDITVTNDAGQSSALVNFSVAASGLPTPAVTCVLGGVPITSPFRFPIGVSTVACTASNSVGAATCSFNVTVLTAPEFTSCPGDITVTNDAGQSSALVNFSVAASGLPTPAVTCMLGGVPITSPFSFPIGVSTVTCTASNSVGIATCSFNVTVLTAPVLSCPGDITVTNDVGQSSALVNFTVAASGTPAPSVTCLLGGVPIASPFRFPIGVSTVTCTASNSVGVATCSFNVTVLTAPVLSCPGDITTTNDVGQSSALVNFTVAASGMPAPSVTCLLGGVPIASPFKFPIGVSTVTCTASNSVGVSTCSFSVTVLATPVLFCPSDITTTSDAGESSALVKFQAAAAGLPTPVITYMLGDVPITSPFRFSNGVSTVMCTASNSIGIATCSFNVTVLNRGAVPEFTSFPGDLTVSNDVGQCSALVQFTVEATGLPAPVVTCMLGDLPISSPFTFPKGVSTVTCVASNILGATTRSFEVTVQDREEPTVALQPTDKNDTFVLLSHDNCDPNPQIFVIDSGSAFVAGPFDSGDVVKITINPHTTPKQKNTGGLITITLNGDPVMIAIDADGNYSGGEAMKSYLKSGHRGKGPDNSNGRGWGPVKSNGHGKGLTESNGKGRTAGKRN